MTHLSEEDLILIYYDEPGVPAAERCMARSADLLRDFDAFFPEFGQHSVVMDQFAQDSERSRLRLFECQCNGVAHAEAHTEMFCTNDFHILCVTKHVTTLTLVCSKHMLT